MRQTLAGAALVLTLGLTAACGSDDSDPAAPKPSASATTSAPTPEAAWSADVKPQRPADEQSEAGALAYGAAGLTGWSRVHAGEHTPQQVWTGALIGFSLGAASFGIGTDGASFNVGMKF